MPQKKSISDDEVLEKALLVISEIGPETFTLLDIGKAVGLAPSTLMQRFGSKQALLIKAAKHVSTKLKNDSTGLKKKRLSWEAELIELLSTLPEGLQTRQEIANSLGLLRLDMVDPELHPIARQIFVQLRTSIKEVLVKAKNLRWNIDSTTWELDALRHGLLIQWTLSGEGALSDWMKKGVTNYIKGKK